MAELNLPSGKSGNKHFKRLPLRVDLTAMVDLAFLLITFFMLTTSLTKPKIMPVAMPSDGPPGAVSDKATITFCLGKNNKVLWYQGMAEHPLTPPALISYGKDMRAVILAMTKQVFASTGKRLMVLVKPADHSIYTNLVDTFDELNITQVPSYAIAKISTKDIDLLKGKGIY